MSTLAIVGLERSLQARYKPREITVSGTETGLLKTNRSLNGQGLLDEM
ncbi:MAG: hypothetical protein ACFB0E_00950 [Leptolyngbyaceae cyanobacterium]